MLLFETIKIYNGSIYNLPYHNNRLNHSRKELFGREDRIDIGDFLENIPTVGLYKCKVIYNENITNITYTIYKPKIIQRIQLVESSILYPHKYLQRDFFDELLYLHTPADEIMIVKEGLITDTSIANIALSQKGTWYTPESTLLAGTTRARLLQEGYIKKRKIPVSSLVHYDSLALMNAMIGFYEIKISTIINP